MPEYNVPYIMNMAYQKLLAAGESKNLYYMKALRFLSQTAAKQEATAQRIFQLEMERAALMKTVHEQREELITLKAGQ